MTNRYLFAFAIYFLAFLFPTLLIASQVSEVDYWKMLHANSQNLARKVSILRGGQDKSIFSPELSLIHKALEELTESGDLKKQIFEFNYNHSLDFFLESLDGADDLIAEYGVYTLAEMIDIAKFFRGEDFTKNKKIKLVVRLPAKDLERFARALNTLLKNERGD